MIASKERILEITQALWDRRAEISLDDVDGAFYWWGCHPGFIPYWAGAEIELASPVDPGLLYSHVPNWPSD
jgi:hypothetical protein